MKFPGFGESKSPWQVVRVMGENNLQACLEDYDNSGFDIHSVLAMGFIPVRTSMLENAPQAMVAAFTVVAKRRTDA